jgi:hypothetical protein
MITMVILLLKTMETTNMEQDVLERLLLLPSTIFVELVSPTIQVSEESEC